MIKANHDDDDAIMITLAVRTSMISPNVNIVCSLS